MYVCICNALTERRIRQAMDGSSAQTVAEVFAACGVQPQCGKCGDAIADTLDAMLAPPMRLAAE